MQIRKATVNDAKGIAKVQVDTWKTTYKNIVPNSYLNQMTYDSREQMWKQIISMHPVYVAETNVKEIVGFSNGGVERSGAYNGYDGELYAIYILETYQRQGLGKLLLKPIIDEFIEKNIYSMLVLVLEDNPARLFYESLGAKKIDMLQIDIDGKKLKEAVYGWKDIRKVDL